MPLLVPEPISTKVIFFRSVRDPQHFQLIYTKKKKVQFQSINMVFVKPIQLYLQS